jgi:NADH-quinone oxidoreductase subunit H
VVPRWFVLLLIPSFLIFIIAALCELNQTPFDMSEAESELVAGFATEYSSMKFGLIFLAEFSNMFVISALAVTVFFGGWTLPFVPESVLAPIAPIVFVFKTYVGIFVFMWIRGTLPARAHRSAHEPRLEVAHPGFARLDHAGGRCREARRAGRCRLDVG